ncbi:hypothetical protein V2J09_005457 [Rumex salicifolius]
MGKTEKKIPKKVQKYLSSVLSSIKSQTAIDFFHGRKRPKSLIFFTGGHFFQLHRNRSHHRQHQVTADFGLNSASATLDDIDRYLFENFRSLYEENENEDHELEEVVTELEYARSSFEIPLSALIDLRGSNRFFITPVSSGSLIEEARTKSDDSGCESFNVAALKIDFPEDSGRNRALDDCVPVVTVSSSPYDDFLRSMADVMKAGAKHGRGIDWDFMEELLFSYLRLNEKEHYRYVLKAFVDLVVDSRKSYGSSHGGDPVDNGLRSVALTE